MSTHHPMGPSALPMLQACPCFEREAGGDDTWRDKGNNMHKAFADLVEGKPISVKLSPKELEDVQWAAEYVNLHKNSDYPVEVEKRLHLLDKDFKTITYGTADVINGLWIADLKTMEEHDYEAQMACYALMLMQRDGGPFVTVDILYSKTRQVHRHTFTKEECEALISLIMLRVNNPSKKPKANDYCGWCKHLATCPAVVAKVAGVVAGREDWEPETYHSSDIGDPVEMAKALAIARLLQKWVDSVEFHAKAMAMRLQECGHSIPGYEYKERAGSREIIDIEQAFNRSGLDAKTFLSACSASVGKLEEAIAQGEGLTATGAKKTLNERLGDAVVRRPSSFRIEKIRVPKTTRVK